MEEFLADMHQIARRSEMQIQLNVEVPVTPAENPTMVNQQSKKSSHGL